MAHQTASGVTLGISAAAPATHDTAGFDALTFIPVGEITEVGEFGKEWALVTHNPLSTRGTKKGKGSYNNGNLNPSLALDPDDAGQTAMETALESDDPVYMAITLQDGTVFYLVGLVMSFKAGIRGVDDVVTATTSIELTPEQILKKAA
ncbi:hypothetical protein [Phaeobacter gallaeciensis]|uniref:Phage tail protein n=1 Tax=Phaeobacter gallaeciensis TaxID=60890 RepID=A0AAC9Z935_9RHOB|nr:hypothetical protein [Phaeobacter gallaeciensis]AHD09537.1 hypothetical protein Gal_01781 [Phaeobacter gallaeciensis DSM 26640]ATE92802.1 hypothetical protein PhaeoP11_01774 [Phaeobacter gallaeciensis]ATE97376.1 hypothetical protein PhaeoP73_02072 [Phaeobacter gallaeciensis]ATF01467.1 hypothetical protein PhaeoP75_01824 [Phaeobacter gallaeciensis]ATF05847.1 hypothetical protein PhaeoP63_01772 [Phaeobacter gallaeciensis]